MNTEEHIELWISKILDFENKFDVNELQCRGIHLWPILKAKIWGISGSSQASSKQQSYPLIIRKFGSIVKSVLYNNTFNKTINNKNNFICPAQIILFARPEDHREIVHGSYVNPLLDPMLLFCKDRYTCLKIEPFSSISPLRQPRYFNSYYLNTQTLNLIDGFNRLVGILKPTQIANADLLNKMAAFFGLPQLTDQASLIGLAETIDFKARKIEELLHRANPKLVFCVCSYDSTTQALLLACRRCGVTSVEVMHGSHIYNIWNRIPAVGYDLVPDYYWTWGEDGRQYIARNALQGSTHHTPILGGNPWLAAWNFTSDFEEKDSESITFFKKISIAEKLILYTVQNIDVLFPPHFIEAMQQSPQEWLWLIRLHPHHNQRNRVPEIKAFLLSKGITNFEIEQSTTISLPSLLKRIQHHVTCWSATGYEAAAFNVPTTLIHAMSLELFASEIEQKAFGYASDAPAILERIRALTPATMAKRVSPLVVSDPQLAINTIQSLFEAATCTKGMARAS